VNGWEDMRAELERGIAEQWRALAMVGRKMIEGADWPGEAAATLEIFEAMAAAPATERRRKHAGTR